MYIKLLFVIISERVEKECIKRKKSGGVPPKVFMKKVKI
jgi:hypothetical protein